MKIAVTSTGQTLESAVDARLGRCPYFLVVNPATLEFEAIANDNAELRGGAGIQSARLMAEKGVSVVLTGSCGPNALEVFEKAGVKIVTGVAGSVSQVVQQFAKGSLTSFSTTFASSRSSDKLGRGMGRGCGMGGGGRGIGGGGRFR
jgi:predicted Fe-Mo cluster-binding NifX family protein